jgi:hypothetical protein
MSRKEAIIIINECLNRDYGTETITALKSILDYCINMEKFEYTRLINFITASTPRKTGGVYIELCSALRHLKIRLKQYQKLTL